jgi:hypothetical protein
MSFPRPIPNALAARSEQRHGVVTEVSGGLIKIKTISKSAWADPEGIRKRNMGNWIAQGKALLTLTDP